MSAGILNVRVRTLVVVVAVVFLAAGSTSRALPSDGSVSIQLDGPVWTTAGDRLEMLATASPVSGDDTIWLVPAVTQPSCRPVAGDSIAGGEYTVRRGNIVESRIAFVCDGPQRLGVGAVAFSPVRGPTVTEFRLTSVVDAKFRYYAGAASVVLTVLAGGSAMVVQGRNLRPGWPLALVGLAGLAALPALAVRIPLQTLQVAEIVAIALVPVSFLLLSSTGLNRQMALLGIGLLGAVFAQNTPAFALLWIVVGAAGAFCPRLDSRMTGRFARLELFSHGSLVATVLIGAIAARPFLLEVLVWCLYGDRMNVIPFQRA